MTEKLPTGHGGYRPGAGRKPNQPSPEKQEAQANYNQARARREEALASLAEIDLQTRRNELIPADAVQQCWEDMIGRMRGKMLNLPGRLAAAVPACETQQAIEREAMLLVRECLFELAECGLPK
jgi:hypothetical protein